MDAANSVFANVPLEFICPILNNILVDPVISTASGVNFERWAVESWYSIHGNICPVTGRELGNLIPNDSLRERINAWRRMKIMLYTNGQQRQPLGRNIEWLATPSGYFFTGEPPPAGGNALMPSCFAPERPRWVGGIDEESTRPVDGEKFEHIQSFVQAITAKFSEADMAKYSEP